MTVSVMTERKYPIGAELVGTSETHFRVWAPKASEVEIVLESGAGRSFVQMDGESEGYFSGVAEAGAGSLYRFRVDGSDTLYPDPASRLQPDGPHGPSAVVDPTKF